MRLAVPAGLLGWILLSCAGCTPWATANRLASDAYRAVGSYEYERAEALTREALEMKRDLYGNNSTEAADQIVAMAHHARRRSDYDEAERLALSALAIYRSAANTKSYQLVNAHIALADAEAVRDNSDVALGHLHDAREQCLDELVPLEQLSCYRRTEGEIREFRRRLGQYEEAEPYAIAAHHPDAPRSSGRFVLAGLYNLAAFYREYGAYPQAAYYYERSRLRWTRQRQVKPEPAPRKGPLDFLLPPPSIRVSYPAQAHRFFAVVPPGIEHHGNMLERCGLRDGARRIRLTERELWSTDTMSERAALGELAHVRENGWTGFALWSSLEALGYYYWRRGDTARALEYYEEAFSHYDEAWRKMVRDDRLTAAARYLDIVKTLAHLNASRGNTSRAAKLYRFLLDQAQALLNERHWLRLEALASLGSLRLRLGQTEEAEALYSSYLELAATTRGANHPDYAWGLSLLAELRRRQERAADARALDAQAAAVWTAYDLDARIEKLRPAIDDTPVEVRRE